MAVYDHEEQEQLARMRAWWADYGQWVTGVMLAVAVVMVGWQGWQWYQRQQHTEAAALFAGLQRAVLDQNAVLARENAGRLIGQHSSTLYAQLGALQSAHVQMRAGEAENARTQLSWAMEKGKDPALKALARLRLAALEIDQGQAAQAVALLATAPEPAFAARFAELTGDAHMALGDREKAREAYAKAIDLQGKDSASARLNELLELKWVMAGGEG